MADACCGLLLRRPGSALPPGRILPIGKDFLSAAEESAIFLQILSQFVRLAGLVGDEQRAQWIRARNGQVTARAETPARETAETAGSVRPAWLLPELYPFTSRFVDLDGSRVHYIDEGKGPVLLLLHASPAWSFIYRRFIVGLRDRFRCIALDYPGFGLSTAAPHHAGTLPAQAETLARFIDRLALRGITLFVHDSGGPIGLAVAGQRPELFRALILTDTLGWPLDRDPLVRWMIRLVTSPPGRFLNERLNLLPWLVATVAPVRRRLSRAERQAYLRAFPDAAARGRIITLLRGLVTDRSFLQQVWDGLARLHHLPVLLIYGQFDPVRLLGWQARFARVFPRHHRVVVPWEGHFPHEGSPATLVAAIRAWWPGAVEVP